MPAPNLVWSSVGLKRSLVLRAAIFSSALMCLWVDASQCRLGLRAAIVFKGGNVPKAVLQTKEGDYHTVCMVGVNSLTSAP